MTYERAKRAVKQLQAEGVMDLRLTVAERADWAYGNAKMENEKVTREMAQRAVAARRAYKR